jgi:hypothetical protein
MPRKPPAPSTVTLDWQSPELQLHKEFSSLIALLHLINEDEGHPQLGHSSLQKSYEEKYLGGDAVKNGVVKRNPLQAIATLVVREHEIVAVACDPSSTRFVVLANPDHKVKYSFDQELRILVPRGQSSWLSVRKDRWHGLTRHVSSIHIIHDIYLYIILHTEDANLSKITLPL